MRLNTAIVISFLVLIGGLVFRQSYLFIPATTLIASIIDLFTRRWVVSDRLGSMQKTSMILKSIFSLFGLYAIVGQFASIVLVIWWFLSS